MASYFAPLAGRVKQLIAAVVSAGAADADKLVALGLNGKLDPSVIPQGSHSALTGLTSDDHPQYHTDARGDARYSLLSHGHAIANVTGLQAALDGKLAANSIQIERAVIAAGATAVFTAKDKALYAVVLWQTWSALFFAHHPTPGSGSHTAFASIYQGANIAYSTTLVSGKFAAYMDSQSRLCVINGHASAALPVVVIAVGGG